MLQTASQETRKGFPGQKYSTRMIQTSRRIGISAIDAGTLGFAVANKLVAEFDLPTEESVETCNPRGVRGRIVA